MSITRAAHAVHPATAKNCTAHATDCARLKTDP
jgi:hypothetical protein